MGRLEDYYALRQAHPKLFDDPPHSGYKLLLDEQEIRAAEAEMMAWLTTKGYPAAWGEVGIAYQDPFLLILRDAVRYPDNSTGTYIRGTTQLERGHSVAILPLYHQQVLLIRHFRHALRTWSLEIPHGFGTKGLSIEQSALKEAGEEIGATISRLVPLGRVHPDSGMLADVVELFYADVASYEGIDELRGIAELVPTPLAQFEKMIGEGAITDSFTIAAYTRAKLRDLLP